MENVITQLKNDHKRAKQLLEELASSTERSPQRRVEKLLQLDAELRSHMHFEEQHFYPAFRNAAKKREDRIMFIEANEEHVTALKALDELNSTDPATETFAAKAKILKELVEHHAEEEEKEMFPEAKKIIAAEDLKLLGELKESDVRHSTFERATITGEAAFRR